MRWLTADETDGLIPISEDDWPDLVDTLTMGTKVKVKVKAVHERWWRFRFPSSSISCHRTLGTSYKHTPARGRTPHQHLQR